MRALSAVVKKPAFVLISASLVMVVAFAVATIAAVRTTPSLPRITLWITSGHLHRVSPLRYCDIEMSQCIADFGSAQPTHITVGEKDRILVSVPKEVSKGWLLDEVWIKPTPTGFQLSNPEPRRFLRASDPVFSTWIEPRGDGWSLRSLSVKIPSAVFAPEQNSIVWSGVWLACTDDCSLSKTG